MSFGYVTSMMFRLLKFHLQRLLLSYHGSIVFPFVILLCHGYAMLSSCFANWELMSILAYEFAKK